MSSPQVWIGKKAAKATVRHAAHGTVTKATRTPIRTSTLLGAGASLGVLIGFVVGRVTASASAAPAPSEQRPHAHVNGSGAPTTPAPAATPPAG